MELITKIKIGFLVLPFLMVGCNGDDTSPEGEGQANYALATRIANVDQTAAFYLQSIESPDMSGTLDNKNAEEIASSSGLGIYEFEGDVFINDYYTSKIERWSLSSDNLATLEGSVNVSELGYQGNICFKDKAIAFVGGSSQSSIAIFNPTTMQKTGKIDFSAHSRLGEVTNWPVNGSKINIETIAEIAISGQYLYAALNYIDEFSSYTPATSDCAIMVIDLDKVDVNSSDNSEAIVSIISDARGSFGGSWNSGGGSYFTLTDEIGDVYIECHNLWGNQRATFGKPACILRIKNGTTEFDKDYYFDLETASKGLGNPVLNFEYYGNGKFLAAAQNPEAINPENPWSYYIDPIFQWWSFDLKNKTAELITEEYTKAALAGTCLFENGHAYVPFENNEESYIMKVELGSLSTSKTFNTNGTPVLLDL